MPRLLAALAVLVAALRAPAAPSLEVHFFDVGQGDSALVRSPSGKSVLIDGGPPEAGERLANRLKELLNAPIDLVILTHPHLDHLGGLERAIAAMGLRFFWDPGFDHPSPAYRTLLEGLIRRDVEASDGTAGRKVDLGGGAEMRILWPRRPFLAGTRSDVNANSIVVRLRFGRTALLFTGDLEPEAEARLGDGSEDLSARVLKVPHHGGRHSSTDAFLARVRPEVAVVSVGAGNEYGHPTRAAIDRLETAGARVYRTDLDGEISVATDGETLAVKTERPGALVASAPEPVDAPPALAAPRAAAPEPARTRPAKESRVSPQGSNPFGPGRTQPAAAKPAPATKAAAPAPQAAYLGSVHSDVFHRADCARGAARIKPENLVSFPSRDAAVAAGRRPAGCCNP